MTVVSSLALAMEEEFFNKAFNFNDEIPRCGKGISIPGKAGLLESIPCFPVGLEVFKMVSNGMNLVTWIGLALIKCLLASSDKPNLFAINSFLRVARSCELVAGKLGDV